MYSYLGCKKDQNTAVKEKRQFFLRKSPTLVILTLTPDHTCYTVYTAGSGGFLNILPVYMDHILYPLLREEDFMTEVHHISGEGEDAGVVYSEMQVTYLPTYYCVMFFIYQYFKRTQSCKNRYGGT
jgi:Zn-dependent M16 (insulinase) family peptidase